MQRKFALYVVSRRSLCWRPLSSFTESWGVARHFASHFLSAQSGQTSMIFTLAL